MVSVCIQGHAFMAHLYVAPSRVTVEPQVDVVLQRHAQPVHEGRARCDGVAVPDLCLLLAGHMHTLLLKLQAQALLFCFLHSSKQRLYQQHESMVLIKQ